MQCLGSFVWLVPYYKLLDWVLGAPLLRPGSNPFMFPLTNLYLIYIQGIFFPSNYQGQSLAK